MRQTIQWPEENNNQQNTTQRAKIEQHKLHKRTFTLF